MPTHNDYIYMDYAAATPLDERVLAAMQPFFGEQFYNPSATYLPAVQVAQALQTARAQVAHWLGARPSEIIFIAGGTEANNLAIQGLLRQYPAANAVVSAIEHESVLRPVAQYDHKLAPVDRDGVVDVAKMTGLIDDSTVLISIMYANNEIGTIQPLRDITQLVKKIRDDRAARGNRLPLYIHTDACQAAAYLDLHAARLGVDMLTINGGKIYGPKQSGALFVRSGIELQPLVLGGGQERNLRSGTENVAACVGLAAALELAQQRRHEMAARLHALQATFFEQIEELFPTATINGSRKKRLPNNVHVTFPGTDNERILIELEQRGILAAAGSACSASNEEPSHVLRALGLSDSDARASVRFTMGRATDAAAVAKTLTALRQCVPIAA